MEKEQIEFDSGKKVPEIIQIIRDSMQSNYEDASSDVLNYMKFLCEKYKELLFNNSKANSIELAQMYVDFLEYAKSANLSENDVTAVSGRIQEYFENVVFEYSLKKGNEYTYSDGTDVELKIASLFLKKREPIVSKLFNKGILNDVLILAQNSDNRVANFLVAVEEISRNSDRIDLIEDPIQKSKEIAKTYIDFISGRFRLRNVEVRSITRTVQEYLVKSGMSQRESAIFITDELFKMYDKWNPIIKREEYVIGENETFSFGFTERFPEDHFHNYIKYLLPYLKSLPTELKKVAVVELDIASSRINIGIKYFEDCLWVDALRHFEEAMRINNSYPDAYYWTALTLIQMKKSTKAKELLLKAIELNPNYADAYFQLGLLLKSRAKKQSIEYFKKALTLNLRPSFVKIVEQFLKEEKVS